tara:strand:- start:5447 stop:5599 length:153 start_codon:yes stop_codon:yes gene_type:complete
VDEGDVGRVGRRGVKSANMVNLKERLKEEGVRKREIVEKDVEELIKWAQC